MSNAVINFISPKQLKPAAAKSIAFVIANHSDKRGVSWLSVETIAFEACASVETVYRHLKKLERCGLIYRSDRGRRVNGTRLTPYTFVLYSAEAIANAVKFGYDPKFANERVATSAVLAQPVKLPLAQPVKFRLTKREPKDSRIEPSSQPRGAWIRKGSPQWDAWSTWYRQTGIFSETPAIKDGRLGEGRWESTEFPPHDGGNLR